MGAERPVGEASDATRVVDDLLRRARDGGVSDLHLDPSEEGMIVRARRDGVLERMDLVDGALAPRIVGRLKSLADLLVYRVDLPQEGRIPAERSPIGVEARVATFPTLHGERVAIRLDVQGGGTMGLEDLGLEAAALKGLRAALAQPSGVVLFTGPAGSGKTTSLYACLRHLASQEVARSMVTVEDPVERRVPGVTQTQVNEAAGLTFARALRSLLRQDPEVLLVGEIRDRETAAIALEAGLTGHLVVSTVHAGRAPDVFARLLDMGVEPFVLTSVVSGVMAMRLVRCRRGDEWQGRMPLAEWLPMGPALRTAILARADAEGLQDAAVADGLRTLRETADALVAEGRTTRGEIDRVLGTS